MRSLEQKRHGKEELSPSVAAMLDQLVPWSFNPERARWRREDTLGKVSKQQVFVTGEDSALPPFLRLILLP